MILPNGANKAVSIMAPVNKCFYEYFCQFVQTQGNKPFLFDEERCYTAQETFREAIAIGNRFYELGIREGSLVALRCTRSVDAYLIFLALEFMGMVSGHTALAGTAGARLKLSQERAKSVAEYLVQLGVRHAHQIFTQGFGAEKPVAPNTPEEGKARNRRVEITIMDR